MQETRLGEVIEATTATFVAQCHRLGEPPALGSLVTTSDGDVRIYGVVHNAATGSIDPGRRFIALGQEEEREEDVYRSHPELDQLLRTDFQTIVVGHLADGVIRQHLPPRPARIHNFVQLAPEEELREFTRALGFLPVLVHAPVATRDEAVAACIRLAGPAHDDRDAFLVRAGKELAVLLAHDSQRMNTLLRLLRS